MTGMSHWCQLRLHLLKDPPPPTSTMGWESSP
jgi:hypothetical protein